MTTKTTGTKTTGTKTTGTKKTGTKKAGTKKAGTKKAGTKNAGTKNAGKPVAVKKETAAKTSTAKKAGATKPAAKTATAKGAGATKSAAKGAATSMPKAGKDPKGGLTAAGRAFFKEKDGSNLRPGVRGKTDTPEKMMRKGSFLRRHYANPPGPVVDAKGQPTRQALQAAAWGEPVPKNEADERKLAEKGSKLLEQYHAAKGDRPRLAVTRTGSGESSSSS